MRRIYGSLAVLIIAAAAFAAVALANGQEKVTICHASGLAGTTKFETLNIAYPAVYGQAGHFFENGTPRAGHEQDYLGPCEEEGTEISASVQAVQPTCENGGLADLVFGNENGVDYDVEGNVAPGETVNVTAHGLLGFILIGQSEFEFTFEGFSEEECEPPPPPETVFVCIDGELVEVPVDSDEAQQYPRECEVTPPPVCTDPAGCVPPPPIPDCPPGFTRHVERNAAGDVVSVRCTHDPDNPPDETPHTL